ncbi:hypothetical protein MMC07_006839 [Pseudocyphellaria aurata]|nr:hypothetical protein [Pseudocyphellaria aurata]
MPHILELPIEVRFGIFRQLLLTKHSKRATPYQLAIPHTLQPAVLCVCRQFQREAGDVLYRENVFVHIITNYCFLGEDLRRVGLASITRDGAAQRFAHYSLSAVIAFRGPAPLIQSLTHHFMISAEDLDQFCALFWVLRIRRYYQVSLHLHVWAPIGGLQRSIVKQESLLRPFQQLWHIDGAAVDGHIDPGVVQRLKKALTEKIPSSAEARLEFVLSLETEGDRCLRQSDFFGGVVAYYKSFATFQKFSQQISQGGLIINGSDVKTVAEILHNINLSRRVMSNITLCFLKLGAWADVVEVTQAFIQNFDLGLDHLTFLCAHFRMAIALKMSGDLQGSQAEFTNAIFLSQFLNPEDDTVRYLRVEQLKLFGWQVDDEWLELERAKYGFI